MRAQARGALYCVFLCAVLVLLIGAVDAAGSHRKLFRELASATTNAERQQQQQQQQKAEFNEQKALDELDSSLIALQTNTHAEPEAGSSPTESELPPTTTSPLSVNADPRLVKMAAELKALSGTLAPTPAPTAAVYPAGQPVAALTAVLLPVATIQGLGGLAIAGAGGAASDATAKAQSEAKAAIAQRDRAIRMTRTILHDSMRQLRLIEEAKEEAVDAAKSAVAQIALARSFNCPQARTPACVAALSSGATDVDESCSCPQTSAAAGTTSFDSDDAGGVPESAENRALAEAVASGVVEIEDSTDNNADVSGGMEDVTVSASIVDKLDSGDAFSAGVPADTATSEASAAFAAAAAAEESTFAQPEPAILPPEIVPPGAIPLESSSNSSNASSPALLELDPTAPIPPTPIPPAPVAGKPSLDPTAPTPPTPVPSAPVARTTRSHYHSRTIVVSDIQPEVPLPPAPISDLKNARAPYDSWVASADVQDSTYSQGYSAATTDVPTPRNSLPRAQADVVVAASPSSAATAPASSDASFPSSVVSAESVDADVPGDSSATAAASAVVPGSAAAAAAAHPGSAALADANDATVQFLPAEVDQLVQTSVLKSSGMSGSTSPCEYQSSCSHADDAPPNPAALTVTPLPLIAPQYGEARRPKPQAKHESSLSQTIEQQLQQILDEQIREDSAPKPKIVPKDDPTQEERDQIDEEEESKARAEESAESSSAPEVISLPSSIQQIRQRIESKIEQSSRISELIKSMESAEEALSSSHTPESTREYVASAEHTLAVLDSMISEESSHSVSETTHPAEATAQLTHDFNRAQSAVERLTVLERVTVDPVRKQQIKKDKEKAMQLVLQVSKQLSSAEKRLVDHPDYVPKPNPSLSSAVSRQVSSAAKVESIVKSDLEKLKSEESSSSSSSSSSEESSLSHSEESSWSEEMSIDIAHSQSLHKAIAKTQQQRDEIKQAIECEKDCPSPLEDSDLKGIRDLETKIEGIFKSNPKVPLSLKSESSYAMPSQASLAKDLPLADQSEIADFESRISKLLADNSIAPMPLPSSLAGSSSGSSSSESSSESASLSGPVTVPLRRAL